MMNFRVDSPKSYHSIYILTPAWPADFAKNRYTWQRTWSLKEKRTYNIATNTAKVLINWQSLILLTSKDFRKLLFFLTEYILIRNSIPITLFVIQADSNYFNCLGFRVSGDPLLRTYANDQLYFPWTKFIGSLQRVVNFKRNWPSVLRMSTNVTGAMNIT